MKVKLLTAVCYCHNIIYTLIALNICLLCSNSTIRLTVRTRTLHTFNKFIYCSQFAQSIQSVYEGVTRNVGIFYANEEIEEICIKNYLQYGPRYTRFTESYSWWLSCKKRLTYILKISKQVSIRWTDFHIPSLFVVLKCSYSVSAVVFGPNCVSF